MNFLPVKPRELSAQLIDHYGTGMTLAERSLSKDFKVAKDVPVEVQGQSVTTQFEIVADTLKIRAFVNPLDGGGEAGTAVPVVQDMKTYLEIFSAEDEKDIKSCVVRLEMLDSLLQRQKDEVDLTHSEYMSAKIKFSLDESEQNKIERNAKQEEQRKAEDRWTSLMLEFNWRIACAN